MATLTNTKIKDTYDGLLKTTDNEALDVSGVTLIEDGLGNASALSVGRSGNGVTITGGLNATLATAAQPNITSVGTLSSLNVDLGTTGTVAHFEGDATDTLNIDMDANAVVLDARNVAYLGFEMQGSERMRIDSSGNVGIGVTPTSVTHGPHLEVGNLRGTVSAGTGYFEDNGGTNFLNGARPLAFGVAGSERMRIDSSGNVGIGIVPAYDLHLHRATTGFLDTSDFAMGVQSNDNEQDPRVLLQAQKDQTAGGRLLISTLQGGTLSERMRIDSSGNVGIGISPSYRMHLHNTSTAFDATTDLAFGVTSNDSNTNARAVIKGLKGGTNGGQLTISTLSGNVLSERVRFLSGGGITFNGDTSSANALDDYEEGDWTMTIQDQSGNSASFTSVTTRYTKIGRLVNIDFVINDINTSGMVGTDQIIFKGLPFTAATGLGSRGTVTSRFVTISGVDLLLTCIGNTTDFVITQNISGASSSNLLVSAILSGTSDLRGSITYYV